MTEKLQRRKSANILIFLKMRVKIEKAELDDVATVLSVLTEAASWLEKKGIPLWRHDELKRELAERDVERGQFYLAKVGGEVAGCVRFQNEDLEFWDDVPHRDSAFIHRVAVRRKFAGGEVSKAIIDWAKEKAEREGKTFLRLDCAKREKLCRLYENYGFEFHSEKEVKPYLVIRYEYNLRENKQENMLEKAIAHYNELLKNFDLAEQSRQVLDEGLEEAKLIFGGRRLCPYLRPHFVTETDWARTTEICEIVWNTLQKVKEAAVDNDELLDELGITDIERDWISIDPGYRQVSPTARLDSFLTADAYSFVELNGESPAGIAYADSATAIFMQMPVMKKFAETYEVRGLEGRDKTLDVLLKCYEEYLGHEIEEKPVIAIVDLKDLPTQLEFELFRDYFQSKGYKSVICSPDELEFDGEILKYNDTKIDLVYRRLLVNEYLPIMDEDSALLEAYRAGAICMANSFRSKIVHKKAIFAVLTNERYADLFTEKELKTIKAHIPWTRKFRDEKTVNNGEEIDLVEWTRANSAKLVLKPNDDYGGHGIYIGWASTAEEWKDAIKLALENGDYLVQERVKTAKEEFPMLNEVGNWNMVEQLVDLDPLLFDGKVGSAFTRLSSSELANVSSGGGMVPTFIISEK